MDGSVTYALIITGIAGAFTGLGGIFVLLVGKPRRQTVSLFLSLAAGLLVPVASLEILPESLENFSETLGNTGGSVAMILTAL